MSWVSEAIYLVIFSLIMGVLILPFAFLVAIASVDIETDVTDPFELGWFFWLSVGLLVYVANLFTLMLMGMVQKIGVDRNNNVTHSIETLVSYPFQEGRFSAFLLLSLYTSILGGVIGVLSLLFDNWLDISSNDVTWDSWIFTIIQIIIFLVIIPPIIFASYSIIRDKSRYDAFAAGWRKYIDKFREFSMLNVFAILPVAVIITAIALVGIVIGQLGEGDEALELFYILSLSFVIILISLVLLFVGLPFYLVTVASGYEEADMPVKEETPM